MIEVLERHIAWLEGAVGSSWDSRPSREELNSAVRRAIEQLRAADAMADALSAMLVGDGNQHTMDTAVDALEMYRPRRELHRVTTRWYLT